ncbi:hypothetical protein TA3x_001654 [Tundrisphaera sp. TA3]|uniref:hypothetical protein n=1 Tax=Tundrisphaera sp. TA3 TaxID=3435775 RepID=UPI003EB71DB1
MRLPRPRITVRRLMILVAAVAILLGARAEVARLRRMSRDYYVEAMLFGMQEQIAQANAGRTREAWLAEVREIERANGEGGMRMGRRNFDLFPPPPPAVEKQSAEYYGKMRAKYERASRYPWLPLPPDPPEPRWTSDQVP